VDFAHQYGPWAVVAGASEGVGASVARALGERGVNVVLIGRRPGPLEDVAASVTTETRVVPLDLSTHTAAAGLAEVTADLDVGLLVYNAGGDSHLTRFLDKPVDVWLEMVARNCTTVVAACHHFGRRFVERGRGGISLVTSAAAWAGCDHLATYGGSKAFDLVFAEALWAELSPAGVDVLAIVLGSTDTPALRRAIGDREIGDMADPDDVARDLLDNLGNGPTFPNDPSPFGPLDRRQSVQAISAGAAGLYE
jgi:short-subunit dehydrogenase